VLSNKKSGVKQDPRRREGRKGVGGNSEREARKKREEGGVPGVSKKRPFSQESKLLGFAN